MRPSRLIIFMLKLDRGGPDTERHVPARQGGYAYTSVAVTRNNCKSDCVHKPGSDHVHYSGLQLCVETRVARQHAL